MVVEEPREEAENEAPQNDSNENENQETGHGDEHEHGHGHGHSHGGADGLMSTSIVTAIAIAIHNFPGEFSLFSGLPFF